MKAAVSDWLVSCGEPCVIDIRRIGDTVTVTAHHTDQVDVYHESIPVNGQTAGQEAQSIEDVKALLGRMAYALEGDGE